MKIRTYIAKDMRQALRQVREEQGPDAVILSTRTIPGGVEVAAAIDFEQASLARVTSTPSLAAPIAAAPDFAATTVQTAPGKVRPVAPVLAMVESLALPQPHRQPGDVPAAQESANTAELGAELRSMRHLLENQLAQLAWNDFTRRQPVHAELTKSLAELGLPHSLASELLSELPVELPFDDAHRRALAGLARRIATTGDSLLDSGGRIAFVGPTGVGKTTAIAKIAARWVLRHGSRDIALVSVDGQRFGAQEQLKVLGRLLGVESFTLDDPTELPALLARLPERRLVLVDTAGISPRDPELTERAAHFNAQAKAANISCYLVLSAGAQAGVLDEASARFAVFSPTACLITKLDEAASLGGTIGMLVGTRLPLSYVSDGQRIPEDLVPARGHQLVARAVRLAREAGATAGEEMLTRRFGGSANVTA